MFIGHFAVGFAAKKYAPRTSLALLLAAPLFLDLVWPMFVITGWEQVRVDPGTIAIWVGVVRHWVLDWITHRPDMPLYPSGPRLGLGLWNSIAGTMIVEISMLVAGVWLYLQSTQARDRVGKYGWGVYVGLLLLLYVGDRFSGPPPSVAAIAWTGLAAGVIFVSWAWWFDRHRSLRDSLNRSSESL